MKKATIILCLLIFVITGIAFFFLPDSIPMHFNAAGEIDRYGSRFEIFLLPILSLLITASSILLKRIDPKQENYKHFMKAFWVVQFSINLFMFVISIAIIMEGMQPGSSHINMIMMISICMLYIVLGNMMPKIKANYFMGIRTPWTLASEDVWHKTHRFAGKIWFFGGIIGLIGIFLPNSWMVFFILGITLILTLIPVIYSYICFKNMKLNHEERKSI